MKDWKENFVNENCSKPPEKYYPTKHTRYYDIVEIWSVDLMDLTEYKVLNKNGFSYIIVIIVDFEKNLWCIPVKTKKTKTITDEISNYLTVSEQSSEETDRRKEF